MSKFVAGHVTKMWLLKYNIIMNYLLLNTNFALKLQGQGWKDDVVTFTAYLSVTIKRWTRHNQKVILAAMLKGKSMPSNMAANTNNNTLLKNQTDIKKSPLNVFPLKVQV